MAISISYIYYCKGSPLVSGRRVTTPIDSKDRIANKMLGFCPLLSKIPSTIGLKDEANVPTEDAIPPPMALDLAGYSYTI